MKFWLVLDAPVYYHISLLSSSSRAIFQLADILNFVLLCIMDCVPMCLSTKIMYPKLESDNVV